MKEYTKFLRTEADRDFGRITHHNNSKWSARTEEQRAQALKDKKARYNDKWSGYLADAVTSAQKSICERMLHYIDTRTI